MPRGVLVLPASHESMAGEPSSGAELWMSAFSQPGSEVPQPSTRLQLGPWVLDAAVRATAPG